MNLGILPYTKESWMDVGKPASERANTYTHANYDMVSILFRSVLKVRQNEIMSYQEIELTRIEIGVLLLVKHST